MKKIILISHKYPPYTGVGGNRWAKITKYLADFGYLIHVISVKWRGNNKNKAVEVFQKKNIIIHRIPSVYPHNICYTEYKNKIINALKKEFIYYLNKYIYFDDEAQRWNYFLIPACEKLIKKANIHTIIATGHPFQANRWAAELKKRNPNIRLIQDFRDPWVHPYKIINSQKQKMRIKKWIRFSITNADKCVFVTKSLGEYVLNGIDIPFEVITNGHDLNIVNHGVKRRKQWIFAGNLSNGRDRMAKTFLDVIKKNPEILDNNTIKFYGHFPNEFFSLYKGLMRRQIIQYCGTVPQNMIHNELIRSKAALHFSSEKFPFALSTKIFEYAATHTPTLVISGGGEIDQLIMENNWGIIAPPDEKRMKQAITEMHHYKGNITDYSVEKYHFKNLARQYADLIQ